MKTFVYARVSTDEQDLQQQMNAINTYLKSKEMSIDELLTDEGVSGGVSYKDRNLKKLIERMRQGDALVVSEISRLGRSMSDLNKLVNDELKPRKLRLIIISMGLDLDCSNLKAIDEMVLFAFSFSAQIEKEMIQERTRNALDARKKLIKEQGYFISKSGRKCTKLGGCSDTSKAIAASVKSRADKARENPSNLFLYRYIRNYESKNGKLLGKMHREVYEQIAQELNSIGATTATGLPYNANRLRVSLTKVRSLYQ